MNGSFPEWSVINQEISDILEDIRKTGPAAIGSLSFHEYTISLSIAEFCIGVSSAIHMKDGGNLVCAIDGDHRYRKADGFRICKVLGEIVSSCVCDDSGMLIRMESGLELHCPKDRKFESYSLSYPCLYGKWFMVFL